jgi:hypothetical protein
MDAKTGSAALAPPIESAAVGLGRLPGHEKA